MSFAVLPKSTSELITSGKRRWLITGGAGFIGSHLAETLLNFGQEVVCLDNFATGRLENIDGVLAKVANDKFQNFKLIEGDIRHLDDCRHACEGVDYVLHHAALGSVPLSIEKPELCHQVNGAGTENVFQAAQSSGVKRVVYASSSAVYGDEEGVPAVESKIGKPLSPYAKSKHDNELSAQNLSSKEMPIVGLRYFNVVGERQDPNGAYAAVIPRWIQEFSNQSNPAIFGDGLTTRDFCPVANVVQANLSSALVGLPSNEISPVCNIALGRATSLNELFYILRDSIAEQNRCEKKLQPVYKEERVGDVKHSCASIELAQTVVQYQPQVSLAEGLNRTVQWYL